MISDHIWLHKKNSYRDYYCENDGTIIHRILLLSILREAFQRNPDVWFILSKTHIHKKCVKDMNIMLQEKDVSSLTDQITDTGEAGINW